MKYRILFSLFAFYIACQAPPVATNIELTKLFTDNMVLQQKINLPIWGTADPGGMVTVAIDDQEVNTIVNETGEWKAILNPIEAGGPFELRISGKDTINIRNVLVGEVWIGSGQSNMQMPLAGWGKVLNYEQEISEANYPNIRLLQVERTIGIQPRNDLLTDGWKICTPENISEFSSTAYFFGRKLHQEINIPIGLIHSSWGGTIIEAWMSSQSLQEIAYFKQMLERLDKFQKEIIARNQDPSDPSILENIAKKRIKEIVEKDRGLNDPAGHWAKVDLETEDWETMKLPVTWEESGLPGFDGVVWFRKEVNLPEKAEITLQISAVDDIDSTYFNGIFIGSESIWNKQRSYIVPKDLTKKGKNIVVVRVLDNRGGGGIWGDPENLKIDITSKESISLAGEWRYKVGVDFSELTTPVLNPNNPNYPTLLSNAMIEPLIPYAIRGVIWYQGESNADRAHQYRTLFPSLIRDWRDRWGVGEFPFIFVQLANFMAVQPKPAENNWAELREAQLMTLTEPSTGMAVAIDIGDAEDIHPKNKQEVGRRLALNALGLVYGFDLVHSGPIYESMEIKGDQIHLYFTNIGEGLASQSDHELRGFAIAGEDRVFHWANATIEGNTVIVSNPKVSRPVAARYAWAANPNCNLYNSADLPASPFRTDDWPGITGP
jgi:sialate O-acetylesterase